MILGFWYEAIFSENKNKYSRMQRLINGVRVGIWMLDLNQLQEGDRVIYFFHPIHWHKGSNMQILNHSALPDKNFCSVDTL